MIEKIIPISIFLFFAIFQIKELGAFYTPAVYAKDVDSIANIMTACDSKLINNFISQKRIILKHFDYDLRYIKDPIIYKNGDIFAGSLSHGKKNGLGIYYFVTGEIYEGEFFSDKRQGFGKMIHKNGNIFFGIYFRDHKDGIGILLHSNGKIIIKGIWHEGQLVRLCK